MPTADLTTERLSLSRWDPARHTACLEAVNARPEVVRYLNDSVPYTPAETAVQSARFAAHWERYGFGLWAVTVSATRQTVGFVGLSHPLWFPELEAQVEVGWRLHPDAWGQGYATEAGRAALSRARELDLVRVIAVIAPGNTASVGVATRLGLTHERTTAHPQRPGTIDIYSSSLAPAR
jgi:RimJ/RimL family protein N-acetyltransferase